jgi:hypothetical protein
MSVLVWYLYPSVWVYFSLVIVPLPSIYWFLDVVLKLQTTSYIKIRIINEKVPLSRADKEKEQSLIDWHNQYVSGTITREKYTQTLGYKYQTKTDIWIHHSLSFSSQKVPQPIKREETTIPVSCKYWSDSLQTLCFSHHLVPLTCSPPQTNPLLHLDSEMRFRTLTSTIDKGQRMDRNLSMHILMVNFNG